METAGAGDSDDQETRGEPGLAARTFVPGDVLGRYELHRLLGQGGMGRVFLARDRVLGRAVALKLLRRDRATLGRLLREARTVASLNHPHIVQLHDVGEEAGEAFLAFEHVDGETLESRFGHSDRDLALHEALLLLRSLASALAYAHAAGVVHCDLKPSNVMIDREGRLRVVDFGLAFKAGDRPVRAGTEGWMAPEQRAGDPSTPRTDVWAFGALATWLLPDRPRPDALVALLARSAATRPTERPAMTEWQAALDALLDRRDPMDPEDGPYRGLGVFAEAHARFFFGREPDVDAFVERLRETHLLPVVGPSGIGKSSFLYAGVIPRLRARGNWTVIAMRPGARPFEELARHLLVAGGASRTAVATLHGALADELCATPTLLGARLETIGAATGDRILVLVDQAEELFTHGAPPEVVAAFLRALVGLAADPLAPVRVVLTIRDDFVGGLRDVATMFVLGRLGSAALRAAIVEPLERFGYRFEDPLVVDEILAELGDSSAALAVLQFACRALWDHRDRSRRVITRAVYAQLGGVAGALGRYADGVIAGMSPADRRSARQVLLALTTGTTRRTLSQAALRARGVESDAVLDQLVAHRLVVRYTPSGGDDAVVELAHETLLQTWGQLVRWIDEARDELRLVVELDEAASFWRRRNAHGSAAWSAAEVRAARIRIAQLGVTPSPEVEAFLSAGEARARRARRTRTALGVGVAALGASIVAGAIVLAITFRREKVAAETATANLGRFELRLEPFDWRDGRAVPVPVGELPAFAWSLFERSTTSEHEPGAELSHVVVEARARAPAWVDRVDAPGGAAFLRVAGRGRPGEVCGDAWVRLQRLPGFTERDDPHTFTIAIPTCRASADATIAIEAGPFIYGGRGEPPTAPELTEPEIVAVLAPYRIDRFETSNARFAPFAAIGALTGYPVPSFPNDHSGDPERPIASIDAFEAEALCRYYGGHLPSDLEWVKAARGGLLVGGAPNPSPRRLYPWLGGMRVCANIDGDRDGYDWVAPVRGAPCTASPYGVEQLVGNVSEWTARRGQMAGEGSMRHVRGGDVMTPTSRDEATTVFRNARADRYFDYSIGVRCAYDPVHGLHEASP